MMNAEQARARDEMGESENLTSIASDPASGLVMLWIEGVTVCRVGLMAIATDAEPPFPKNKLLSKAELGPGTTVGELEDAGGKAGPHVQFSDEKEDA